MTAKRPPTQPINPTNGITKWIRWRGLIAFVVAVLLIGVIWLVVVDRMVKCLIEDTGTKINGARVELAAADFSLSPLGVVLTGLQVTNPDAPMTNAIEVGLIGFSLDGPNLLRRKTIIEEIILDGVRFDTARKSSGAVADSPPAGQPTTFEKSTLSFPSFQVPNVKDILAKEELHSVKFVDMLRADIQAEKERWNKQLAELPDKNKLADYKKRLDSVQSAGKSGLRGIVGGANDVLTIRKELNHDIERIMAAKKSFEENLDMLRRRVDAVPKVVNGDVQRLREQYALSPENLAHLSGMILEGPLGNTIEKAFRWYHKLQPYLQSSAGRDLRTQPVEVAAPLRGKGLDVKFRNLSRVPDFLIRVARLKLHLEAGTIMGLVENITAEQPITGRPLSFRFRGENLKGLKAGSLSGEINRMRPQARDAFIFDAQGYHVEHIILSEREDFPLTLKAADVDVNGRIDILGLNLRGTIAAKLTALDLDAGTSPDNTTTKAIAKTLSGIKEATLKVQIGGSVHRYGLDVTTDVDEVLKRAVGKQIKDQADKLETALRSEITAKTNKPLAELKSSLGGLNSIGDELSARLQQASGLTTSGSPAGGLKLPF